MASFNRGNWNNPIIIIYVTFFMYIFDFITGYHWSIDLVDIHFSSFLWLYPATKVIKWLADNNLIKMGNRLNMKITNLEVYELKIPFSIG